MYLYIAHYIVHRDKTSTACCVACSDTTACHYITVQYQSLSARGILKPRLRSMLIATAAAWSLSISGCSFLTIAILREIALLVFLLCLRFGMLCYHYDCFITSFACCIAVVSILYCACIALSRASIV